MFNNKTNIKPVPKHEKMSSPSKKKYQTLKPKHYENLVLQQNWYQTFNPNLINLAFNDKTNIKTSVGWFF
jgi:hypothetical protein